MERPRHLVDCRLREAGHQTKFFCFAAIGKQLCDFAIVVAQQDVGRPDEGRVDQGIIVKLAQSAELLQNLPQGLRQGAYAFRTALVGHGRFANVQVYLGFHPASQ